MLTVWNIIDFCRFLHGIRGTDAQHIQTQTNHQPDSPGQGQAGPAQFRIRLDNDAAEPVIMVELAGQGGQKGRQPVRHFLLSRGLNEFGTRKPGL